jgi:uncharacterized protein (DUF1800 family)
VATVFENNGAGVKGDMKSVVTAILLDPEARAGDDPTAPTVATFGHLREPILMVSNLLRGLGGAVTATNSASGVAAGMGQNLFNEGSVFSYFSPANSIGPNLLGPEFQIYSTQTAATTANDIYNATYGGSLAGAKLDLSAFTQYSGLIGSLLDEIDLVFLHQSMSAELRQQAQNAATSASSAAHAVSAALYIVLTSGEYSVIH